MKLTLMGWYVDFEETNQINFSKDSAIIRIRKVYIRKGIKRCKQYIYNHNVITKKGFTQQEQFVFKTEDQLMDYLLTGVIHENTKLDAW